MLSRIGALIDAGDGRALCRYQLDLLRRGSHALEDLFLCGTVDERVERIALLTHLLGITQQVTHDAELHAAAQEQLRRLSASE